MGDHGDQWCGAVCPGGDGASVLARGASSLRGPRRVFPHRGGGGHLGARAGGAAGRRRASRGCADDTHARSPSDRSSGRDGVKRVSADQVGPAVPAPRLRSASRSPRGKRCRAWPSPTCPICPSPKGWTPSGWPTSCRTTALSPVTRSSFRGTERRQIGAANCRKTRRARRVALG